MGLKISLLGPFDVQVDGRLLGRRHSRKENWLLALLALRHGRELSREWLAGRLWPDSLESQALSYLRQNIYLLKQALGDEARRVLSPTSRTILLDLTGAEVDVAAFDQAIRTGDTSSLEAAAGLYRGPLLEGCDEEWILNERLVREQAFLQCLETLSDRALERGDPATALPFLRQLIRVDPLREAAHRSLMQALVDDGNVGAMARAYRDLRLILYQEVNSEPDPQTVALYQYLRKTPTAKSPRHEPRAKPQVAPTPPLDPATDHCASAEDPCEAPPRPPETASPASLIPTPITALVGREELVREVVNRLGRARLVTLSGTGGVGKTRVAIDTCHAVAGAVWFVELASVRDAMHVALTVAKGLGVAEQKDAPPEDAIADWLASRPGLLVLDNCEHLLESCALLCARLLHACPGLRILVTSRQMLGIVGEISVPVPALELPPSPLRSQSAADSRADLSEILMEYDSVRLFVERAQALSSGFALTTANGPLVAQICRRLDGIPLAIELAAARVNVLSIAEIVKRLDNRFSLLNRSARQAMPHHQTLRASVDWSYNLLTADERHLLERLAVFAGGCTLAAVEQIVAFPTSASSGAGVVDDPVRVSSGSRGGFAEFGAGAPADRSGKSDGRAERRGGDALDVVDLLSSLVDKSLVNAVESEDGIRYDLLETIREFAAEKLGANGEWEAVHQAHYSHHLALMERMKADLWGAGQRQAVRTLEAEHDNMRAALHWSLEESKDTAQALLLAAELSNYWLPQGYFSEARAWLGRALARVGAGNRTEPRAYALQQAGVMAFVQSDLSQASALLEEAVSIRRELGLLDKMANSLTVLTSVERVGGNLARAAACVEEALAIYRQQGHQQNIANALNNLGLLKDQQGDLTGSAACLEESLSLYRAFANAAKMATPMANLANIAYQLGDCDKARRLHEEVLGIHEASNNRPGIAISLGNLGQCASALGDFAEGERLLVLGLHGWIELGSKREIIGSIESIAAAWVGGAAGRSDREMRPFCRAAQIFGAADSLRKRLQLPRDSHEEKQFEKTMALLRSALAQEQLDACSAVGRSMSLEAVVPFTLESDRA